MKNLQRSLSLFIVLLIVSLSFQNCILKKKAVKKPEVDLSGEWTLTTLNDVNAESLFKEKIPLLKLDQSKNEVSGNSGCKDFLGFYSYEEGRFNATLSFDTLLTCDDNTKDSLLFELFETQSIVKKMDNYLRFYKQGNKVAEFITAVHAEDLSGTWNLVSVNGQDIASIFFQDDEVPTIIIDAESSHMSGFTGCNTYNAAFDINGNILDVKGMMLSQKSCFSLIRFENQFVHNLSGKSAISLATDKETLYLTKKGISLLKFEKDKKKDNAIEISTVVGEEN